MKCVCLTVFLSNISVVTWLDGGDTSSCRVPHCLEAKVFAAVRLLVQADPHLRVDLLKKKNAGEKRPTTTLSAEMWSRLSISG